jgi:hypothetical protein
VGFTRGCLPDTLDPELVTSTAIHPNVIAGETSTLAPVAPGSQDDLDRQHELGRFLTPDPVADFMASLFEIHQSAVHLLDAGLEQVCCPRHWSDGCCEPRKPKLLSGELCVPTASKLVEAVYE